MPLDDLATQLGIALRDRYVIGRSAGAGGMAVVYRARDLRHGRQVVVKVVRPEISASIIAERFRREIDIAARLQHPNIVAVFDSGEAAGLLYYVMPFISGDSLRARLVSEGSLPEPDALAIVREVADALAWAHRSGVVHRDIKPENILFSAGHALVTDFGVACALDADIVPRTSITEVGWGVGTPIYMSPEQAFAEPVDGRSDQYALGCVLYEMLTGLPPFAGLPSTALLLQKTTRDVPPPRAASPVSPHVELALLRSLAREPMDRFPTLDEFLAALSSPELPPPSARHAAPRIPSIAVLPFTNNGEADDRYFSDGLADELIHALGASKGLRVLGRTTSFAMADDGRELPMGSTASVDIDFLLRGSVRRSGAQLRVLAHLVDARSGFEMWSERYDRPLRDVFEIQDDITRSIVEALRAELLATGPAHSAVANLGAYELYLKARFHWNRRTVTGIQRSVQCLNEAVTLDASYAPALAALAEAHVTLAIYGLSAPETAMRDARNAAERALVLDPSRGEAVSAIACVRALWDWDYAGGATDFQRALGLSPQYATAHQWYAMHVLVPRGQFPQAFRQLMRAYALDPLSPSIAVSLGLTHFYARDHAAAADAFEALIARDAAFAPAHAFLGQVRTEMGAPRDGMHHLERALQLVGDSAEWIAALGVARSRAGDAAGAKTVLAQLRDLSTSRYVSPVLTAQVHAALGDLESALNDVDAAVALRSTDLAWIGVRPVFDGLHAHPRFRAQLSVIGLASTLAAAP